MPTFRFTSFLKTFLLLCMLSLTASCYYSHPNRIDHWVPAEGTAIDSVQFRITHYYWKNYNFTTCHPLQVYSHPATSLGCDTDTIPTHTQLIVADLTTSQKKKDSIWVKLVTEHAQVGWVSESKFLDGSIPDDPISRFIHFFSNKRTLIFGSCFLLFLGVFSVHFLTRRHRQHLRLQVMGMLRQPFAAKTPKELTFYPNLCAIVMALTATLYGFIQQFAPETWVEFYFNPTLSPFKDQLPHLMQSFLLCCWSLLIVGVAFVIDSFRKFVMQKAILQVVSVLLWAVAIYLVFTITVNWYIGYVLLPIAIYFLLHNYYQRYQAQRYLCGQCGRPMAHLGTCPHCGAINE